MSARRFLWVVLLVALFTMVATLIVQRQQPPAEPPPATAPAATATAAMATTTAPQAETSPATAVAPAEIKPAPAEIKPGPAETKPAPAETKPAPAETKPAPATAPSQTRPATQSTWAVETHETQRRVLGALDSRSNYKLQLELTSLGAAVSTVKLSEHFMTVADKHRYKRDPDTYQQAVAEDPDLKGQYPVLNPVASGGGTTLPLATRKVYFPDEKLGLDMSGPRWRAGEVRTDEDGTQSVTFATRIDRDGRPCVDLEKTYRLRKGSYSIEIELRAVNLGTEELELDLTQFGPTGVPREDIQSDRRTLAYGKLVSGDLKVLKEGFKEAAKMIPGLKEPKRLGRSDQGEAVVWVGVTNKFFAGLAYVVPQGQGELIAAAAAKADFFGAAVAESPTSQVFLAGMTLGPYRLKPGQAADVSIDLFVGPKQRDLFDGNARYKLLNYKGSLDFGGCFCTFAPLSLAMMWLLDMFSKAALGNYGLAIVLLVVLVRVALHPLTKKSQISMMGMKKLQPEMEKIKEKYKDDKPRLNEEMMKLYKSAGATPILGCLPMVLQMPIWIALWTGLQAAVELRHAGLLPVWITDLAAPDALYDFGRTLVTLPVAGPVRSFNLLPLLLSVAMFLQQKLTPSTGGAPGQQEKTQKQMMYFMTVFFLLIFYNAPSGLTMYIMASTFAGLAEQYVIRKHIRQQEAIEAATETKVVMPGKRFRGQKPKKPKGPFRTTR